MIKKLLAAIVLITLLCAMVNAQMPQKGDRVRIMQGEGLYIITVDGTVTAIGDGLICLNSTRAEAGDNVLWNDPTNICIGAGSITLLRWFDEDWMLI